MEPVPKSVCEARMQGHNERFDRDLERINKLEERQEELIELSLKMGEILKNHDSALKEEKENAREREKELEERLKAIENRPVKWWEKFSGAIIGALGTALGGSIVAILYFAVSLNN